MSAVSWISDLLTRIAYLFPLRYDIVDVSEVGLLMSGGRPTKMLTSDNGIWRGIHLYWHWWQDVFSAPAVPCVKAIHYQTITTSDHEEITVSTDFSYQVIDPVAAFTKIRDFEEIIDDVCQGQIAEVLGRYEFEDIMSRREEILLEIQINVQRKVLEWGVEIVSLWFVNFARPQTIRHQFDDLPLGITYV